jgi:hypothetical protein
MKPYSDELDITSLDLTSLTPQQRDALLQRAMRRAHTERARVLAEMCSHVGTWLRWTASDVVPGTKVAAAYPIADHNQA